MGEDFWPETYDRTIADRIIEVSDADSFAFTRRLAREEAMLVGGSSGMAAYAARQLAHELAAEGRDDAVIVVLLPDSGRGYLTKVFNDAWLGQYGFATEGESDLRTVGEVLRGKSGRLPDLVHTHPSETIAEAVHILQEYGVSQMPVVRAEPPIVAAEVAGSVSERALLDALFAGTAKLTDPVEDHMSAPLPSIGSTSPAREAVHAAGEGRRRARPRGRQARRGAHPAGPAGLPGEGLRRMRSHADPPRPHARRRPALLAPVLALGACSEDEPADPEAPVDVEVGEEFTWNGFTVPAGWEYDTITETVALEEQTHPLVRAKVVNDGDEARSALFEFVFVAEGEALATVRCNSTEELAPDAGGRPLLPGLRRAGAGGLRHGRGAAGHAVRDDRREHLGELLDPVDEAGAGARPRGVGVDGVHGDTLGAAPRRRPARRRAPGRRRGRSRRAPPRRRRGARRGRRPT